jgi:pimeloyl-ACP methyl ester carboxylesterase
MGANIASIYAGTRPQRVRQVAMLDFLGLSRTTAEDAPKQLNSWIDNLAGKHKLWPYKSTDDLAKRLLHSNPRLTAERADFLARHVSRVREDGLVEMACDPWHKIPSPNLYKIEDVMSFWRSIVCPVHMLIADDGFVFERFGTDSAEYHERIGCFAKLQVTKITNAGHNVQHDQPEQVAAALESFLIRE